MIFTPSTSSLTKALTILAMVLTATVMPATAAQPQTIDDPMELDINTNIATPALPSKQRQAVRDHIDKLRRSLLKHDLKVVSTRNGEVLHITIPAERLFAPNSTEIKASGLPVLAPLVQIARQPKVYKLLVAVYSDNTGDADYSDTLTAERANAVDGALYNAANVGELNLIPYGMGSDDPLVSNDSWLNRAANRRVEIFVVPDTGLIDAARAGRLK